MGKQLGAEQSEVLSVLWDKDRLGCELMNIKDRLRLIWKLLCGREYGVIIDRECVSSGTIAEWEFLLSGEVPVLYLGKGW